MTLRELRESIAKVLDDVEIKDGDGLPVEVYMANGSAPYIPVGIYFDEGIICIDIRED